MNALTLNPTAYLAMPEFLSVIALRFSSITYLELVVQSTNGILYFAAIDLIAALTVRVVLSLAALKMWQILIPFRFCLSLMLACGGKVD